MGDSPTATERIIIDYMQDYLDNFPINPIIFAGFLRYQKVFRKIGEAHHKGEKRVNGEDLDQGMEALGLTITNKLKLRCQENIDDFTIKALTEEEEEEEPKTPYNWNKAYKFAAKDYSRRLEKYKR